NTGVVGGNRVDLEAQTGIGDVGGPLVVKVSPTLLPFNPNGQDAASHPIVDLASDTIEVGTIPGLGTGTQITYRTLGNSAIGGLSDGSNYFPRITDAKLGKIQLFDTQAHAVTGGITGLVNLSSNTNTGTGQRFTITTATGASLYA